MPILFGNDRAEAIGCLPDLVAQAQRALSAQAIHLRATQCAIPGLTLKGCVDDYTKLVHTLPEGDVLESITVATTIASHPVTDIVIQTAALWNWDDHTMTRQATFHVTSGLSRQRFLSDEEGDFPASACVMNEMLCKMHRSASFLLMSGHVFEAQGQPSLDFAKTADVSESCITMGSCALNNFVTLYSHSY